MHALCLHRECAMGMRQACFPTEHDGDDGVLVIVRTALRCAEDDDLVDDMAAL